MNSMEKLKESINFNKDKENFFHSNNNIKNLNLINPLTNQNGI